MSKYLAKKTEVDGIKFDSQAEARRYVNLRNLEIAGHIRGLQLQPVFELAPAVRLRGEGRKKPAIRYIADFSYITQHGRAVVEDVKGAITPVFRLKLHLMKTVHGIDVEIVK